MTMTNVVNKALLAKFTIRKGTSKMAQHNDIQTSLPGSKQTPTGVATGRVAGATGVEPEHQRLEVFIGRWINEGSTVASADAPPSRF